MLEARRGVTASKGIRTEISRKDRPSSPERIGVWVKEGKKSKPINFDDILFFECEEKKVYMHTCENAYLVDRSLSELEEALMDHGFRRIHKSYLVNWNRIFCMEKIGDRCHLLYFEDTEKTARCSRSYAHIFHDAFVISKFNNQV